jgi:ABC-type uncharacterized transport system permease subunit
MLTTLLASGIATGLAALTVPTALRWKTLPENVPTRFGFSGGARSWGRKTMLLIFPACGVFGTAIIATAPLVPGANMPTGGLPVVESFAMCFAWGLALIQFAMLIAAQRPSARLPGGVFYGGLAIVLIGLGVSIV